MQRTARALTVTAMAATAAIAWAASFPTDLGVDESVGVQAVQNGVAGGSPNLYPARNTIKAASPALRTKMVQEALAWAKAYTESPEFAAAMKDAGINPDQVMTFLMRDYGLGFPEDGLYAKADWIDHHGKTALAVRRATLAAWEYARNHPEEALDIVIAEAHRAKVPVNRSHERWMLRHILDSIFVPGESPERVGTLSPSGYQAGVQALVDGGHLKNPPSFLRFAPFEKEEGR